MKNLFETNTIIYGPQGSGKSQLAAALAKLKRVQYSLWPNYVSKAKAKTELIVVDEECPLPVNFRALDIPVVFFTQDPDANIEGFEKITVEEAKARLLKFLHLA
jgi:energy-coupling factor transporter ATP-binding protein EcfA2